MMAEVIVNGVALDLSDDFSITIEKNSRITQFESIIDTWAYNLYFPRTETNEAAFEHADRFEKKWSGMQEYCFVFYYNGRLILDGWIKIKYSNKRYEGYAYGHFGLMSAGAINSNLRSLDYPVLSFVNKTTYSGEDPYCLFTVENKSQFIGHGPKVGAESTDWWLNIQYNNQGGSVNQYDSTLNKFIIPAGETNGYAVISPFMFFWYLIEKVLDNFSIKVSENVLKTDAELKKTCMFTTYDICDVGVAVPIFIYINGLILDDGGTYTGEFNVTNLFSTHVPAFQVKDLLPLDWNIKDFLLSIQNAVNVIIEFSASKSEAKIIDREAIFSQPAIDLNQYLIHNPELEPGNKKKYTLKYAIDKKDSYWAENNDAVSYKELTDEQWARYKGEVANLTELVAIEEKEPGDIYFVNSDCIYRENKTYRYIENSVLVEEYRWVDLTKYCQPVTIGDEGEDEIVIETKLGLLWERFGSTGVDMPGNGVKVKQNYMPFTPRLMFYRESPNTMQLVGNIKACPEGEKGLYEKRWKKTIQALRGGIPGIAYFNFNEVDFQTLNLNKKFRIEEGEFLIEKTTTTFHLDKVGITEAQIIKLT